MKHGDSVSTSIGTTTFTLGKPFSPGGQGTVFPVDGKPLVVKFYHSGLLSGSKKREQTSRLTTMVKEGPPSPAFVWPVDVIERPEVGYVMPRVSPDFKSLRDLNWNAGCLNWTSRLRICYRLTHAFASLHLRRGYAYCDLSSSNIFCQPATGDIRIIDTDNLAIDGYPNILGIIGTPRYMAPELHRGSTQQPSILTDLHSLAVLIFETLLLHHPLLGDRVLEGPPELEDKVLGSHPVYIYHPQDKSNRYTKYQEFGGLLPTVLPQRLLQLFNETFVHGIKNPQLRVRETRWQRALVDSLDEVIPCSNKQCNFGGTFLRGKPWNTKCDWCGSPFKPFLVLKFLGRRGELLRAKVITGTERLAAHHCKLNEPLNFSPGDACAQVEEDPQHGLTLRNISKETLLYRPPAGESFAPFPPEKRIILREGTRIQFGAAGAEAEVVA